MPIALTTPISGPVVTRKEVVAFTVNLQNKQLHLRFADLTAEGQVVGESSAALSLSLPNGDPRFTAEEYALIKAAVYRLAIESGVVLGVVE